jgi:hypothetical protein
MSGFTKEEIEEFKAEASSRAFDPVCSDDEEDAAEKDNFDGWVEQDDEVIEFKSLFGEHTFPSLRELIDHDRNTFGFDLDQVVSSVVEEDISFIQLINFVRFVVNSWDECTLEKVQNLQEDILGNKSFRDDKFMFPQIPNDPVLYLYEEVYPSFGASEDAGES